MSSYPASSDPLSVVDDWQDTPPPNDFATRLGTLKRRQGADGWSYGFGVEDSHRNGAGVMHGGALVALIDEVVGTVARDRVGRPHVTVHLSTAFLKPVHVGDFVESRCEIVEVTGSMTFVEAKLHVGERVVATASLILKAARSPA